MLELGRMGRATRGLKVDLSGRRIFDEYIGNAGPNEYLFTLNASCISRVTFPHNFGSIGDYPVNGRNIVLLLLLTLASNKPK